MNEEKNGPIWYVWGSYVCHTVLFFLLLIPNWRSHLVMQLHTPWKPGSCSCQTLRSCEGSSEQSTVTVMLPGCGPQIQLWRSVISRIWPSIFCSVKKMKVFEWWFKFSSFICIFSFLKKNVNYSFCGFRLEFFSRRARMQIDWSLKLVNTVLSYPLYLGVEPILPRSPSLACGATSIHFTNKMSVFYVPVLCIEYISVNKIWVLHSSRAYIFSTKAWILNGRWQQLVWANTSLLGPSPVRILAEDLLRK
jgi:hypothetical protein